jgi:hypothetical protein
LACTSLLSNRVAHVCLRSWKRISGRPAFRSRGLKERVTSSWRPNGVPTRVVNTSPLSSHSPASLVFSASWLLRCLLRALFATSGSLMERFPLTVFGGLKATPFPTWVDSVRRTCTVPVSRFTSSHFRPRSSPYLIPVLTASTYKGSSLSPLTSSNSARACVGERGFISYFSGWGALTASVTLRGMSLSTAACFRALCRVT